MQYNQNIINRQTSLRECIDDVMEHLFPSIFEKIKECILLYNELEKSGIENNLKIYLAEIEKNVDELHRKVKLMLIPCLQLGLSEAASLSKQSPNFSWIFSIHAELKRQILSIKKCILINQYIANDHEAERRKMLHYILDLECQIIVLAWLIEDKMLSEHLTQ